MKVVLRIAGVLLIAAISNRSPAKGIAYYCGHCVLHCGEQTTDYYYISPNDCCRRADLCGGVAEWYPDMCAPDTLAIAC